MSDTSISAPALPPPPPATSLRNGRPAGPPVFLLALVLGLSLHLGVLVLFRFTLTPTKPVATPSAPQIHFNADSPALRALMAQAQYSPEQTFLTTEKSFSGPTLPLTTSSSHPVFPPYNVQPTHDEVDILQPVHTSPAAANPGDVLKPTQWDLLSTIGQAPNPGVKPKTRGAFVRITRITTFNQSSSTPVDLEWPPNLAPATGAASWQPVSFLLHFDATGLASEPVLMAGLDAMAHNNTPNDAEVNNFLREKLKAWFTQHPPLPPGNYEAVIGP